MKKIRILTLASVFALSGLMTGCFEDATNSSSAPVIEEFEATFGEATATWTSGLEIEFYGAVTDDNALTQLKLELIDAAGKATLIKAVAVSGDDVVFGVDETVKFQITNPGTWGATGAYKVRLTATDNDGLTSSKELSFKEVQGTGTAVTTLKDTTVDMRASSSSLAGPPYLDVDAMVTYGTAAAGANSGVVDLRFNNTSSSSEAGEIRAPSAAEAGTSMAGWTTKNATKFHKVTGKYATTNTQAGIDALYNAGSAVDHIVVANGDEIVVKSVSGKVVLIKINSITGPGTADVQFSVKGYK